MKLLLAVGLITACLHSGMGAATVRIRAYRATGEVEMKPYRVNKKVAIAQGTRLLLTCDVTGLPENSEVVRYRWFHSLTGDTQGRYQIQDKHPYYRVVKDTLLVDVTSLAQGGKYYCFVSLSNAPSSSSTAIITVEGNPALFLYTPTSILPEHSVLTDVQQATGRNGQQWITCRSGGRGTRPEIWMGSELVPTNSTANSATIGLDTQHPNGLYHCSSAQSQKEYFSLFFTNSVTLPTPTRSARNNSIWTLTSPGGSRVERYIVEFECSVRNITFVEKYMSVSASGGTGRVATSASCFGGLGQLYRAKVWAVSGPSISPALVCTSDGQCREDEAAGQTGPTTVVTTPTNSPSSSKDIGETRPTTEATTLTNSPSSSTYQDGTFIPVGVGVGMLLLLVMSLVLVIVVVVAVMKKAARNQKRKRKIRDGCEKADDDKKAVYTQKKDAKKPHYNTSLMKTERKRSHGCEYEDVDMGEERGSIIDGFSPHEDVDSEAKIEHVDIQDPQESSVPASATKTPPTYAVVDKCKKMGAQWQEDNGYTVAFIHQRTMPMMGEMSDRWKGVIVSDGVEEAEQYEDTAEISKCTPRVHPRSGDIEEREQYEDTVSVRYEALENQRRTCSLGSDC